MRDTDLDNDRVKLVKYTIVTIKRGREEILKSGGEQLVTQRLSGEAFASWMIAKYIQEHKSEMDEEDKQYLRVYYDVMESWPKQDLKYEENRLNYEEQRLTTLREIKDVLEKWDRPAHEVITNAIGMQLVRIPAGEFLMGSPETDPAAHDDEKPQHHVRITTSFYISMYAVTVGQWQQFVTETSYATEGERSGQGSTGLDLTTGKVEQRPEYTWRSWLRHSIEYPSDFQQTDAHPVVCVSWNDAQEFCRWLSDKEQATYRLPTEAEWEYACRARTTTRFYSGDDEDTLQDIANIADASLQEKWVWRTSDPPFPEGTSLPPYAKPWNDGYPFTAPVGRFKPNAFGLHDMLGNVGEWCSDWYDPDYYRQSPQDDPQGPPSGPLIDISDRLPGAPPRTLLVIRGGVWLDSALDCRSADRQTHRRHPIDSAADIGFRVVRESQDVRRIPGAVSEAAEARREERAVEPKGEEQTALEARGTVSPPSTEAPDTDLHEPAQSEITESTELIRAEQHEPDAAATETPPPRAERARRRR